MASYFYHLNENDTISPLSSSGLVATYTSNKSWFLIVPNSLYFKEDKYRAKLVGGLGSIEFQTFERLMQLARVLDSNIYC